MTRNDFIAEFRQGLGGLPRPQIEDLVTDYQSHFDEGVAAGRSEDEIAAALGDPARLARELRAEAGFKRWEQRAHTRQPGRRNPGAVGTGDSGYHVHVSPFLALFAIVLSFGAVALSIFIVGLLLSMMSLFPSLAWPPMLIGGVKASDLASVGLTGGFTTLLALGLAGLGLIAGGVSLGALVWLVLDVFVKLLVRYARLHFELINAVSA